MFRLLELSLSRALARSGKLHRSCLGELRVGPALVQPTASLGDGALKPRLVFAFRALEMKQERPVDLLGLLLEICGPSLRMPASGTAEKAGQSVRKAAG